jgi:hypothetical protein
VRPVADRAVHGAVERADVAASGVADVHRQTSWAQLEQEKVIRRQEREA